MYKYINIYVCVCVLMCLCCSLCISVCISVFMSVCVCVCVLVSDYVVLCLCLCEFMWERLCFYVCLCLIRICLFVMIGFSYVFLPLRTLRKNYLNNDQHTAQNVQNMSQTPPNKYQKMRPQPSQILPIASPNIKKRRLLLGEL